MFRRIVLDPEILRKLHGIGRGKRIRHKRPEAAKVPRENVDHSQQAEKEVGCSGSMERVLGEHFTSVDPFGAPSCPICVQRVQLGGRDEWGTGAQRLDVSSELRELFFFFFLGGGKGVRWAKG